MERIAVFDFCDTLVNFQTADEFVLFCMNRKNIVEKNNITKVAKFIDRKTLGKFLLYKKALLYHLKGLSKECVDSLAKDYYDEKVACNLQEKVVELLKKYKSAEYKIFISSSGYEPYIKYFADEYEVDYIFSNIFDFKNNVFGGRILGKDCKGTQKVRLLNDYLKNEQYFSVAISDSKSDLPLLQWADEGIVISKTRSRSWIKENGFMEIVLAL